MSEENMSGDEGTPDPIEGIGDPVELAKEDDGFLGTPWSRRTFLKAAALGTAAAAVFQKGPGFTLNPASAYANDLSGLPCTANDVVINGPGITQNEPCSCTGNTFNAVVSFPVTNNTGTGRYCIALHIPGGFGVPAQDVLLNTAADGSGTSTAPANTTTTMYGTITGFPCNSGGTLVCLGTAGVTRGKCADNTCVTIAWSTSSGSANCTAGDLKPAGGQCRHQQICIQGYGASLTCANSDCTASGNCSASCGGTAHLKAVVGGGTSPYFFTLDGDDGTSQRFPASGTTTQTSHCFAVTPTAASTVYTLTVTDADGCTRTATATVTTTAISPTLAVAGDSNCNGVLTFSATLPSGTSGCTLTYSVDGTDVTATTGDIHVEGSGDSKVLKYRNLDGSCHTVAVSSNCSGCAGSDSINVEQCVTTTKDCTIST